LLETAQTGADNFAGGLVEAAVDFLLHELFKLRRE
jgi:hypothetical protein